MEYRQQDQMPADGYGASNQANARALPKRVRGMLDEIRSHGCALLQLSLRRTLASFEQHLFTLAEKTRDPAEQQHCFDSRMLLQAGQRDFEAVFNQTLQRSLRALGASSPLPITDSADHLTQIPRELSLVDPIEQEYSVILDKLAARAESRHSRVLFELGYRLAAVQAGAPIKSEELPFGPKAITQALECAIGTLLTMRAAHRIQLLNTFENGLMAELEPLYRIANERLIAGGILPHLRAFPQTRSGPRVAATVIPLAATAAPPMPHVAGEVRHEVSSTHDSHVDHPRSESIVVLDELRQLLAQQRTQSANGAASHVATTDELEIALGALQKHLTDVADHATREILSAQALCDEILNQLNSNVGAGDTLRQLSLEQHDMVDLIALLFQQLGQQVPVHDQAKSVLGGLQLPMLRMAMTDNSFFNTREHPAHKLLNAVAETAQHWLQADGQTDHAVATQLTKLVERANREPPSAGLYASLLADIEHQLGILARKAQLAERRHVETMQGRERLDQARQRASVLMAQRFMRERFATHHPRGLVRVLLEHAWTDVLALSLLRNGEDSARFAQWLKVTDQLFGALPITDSAVTQKQIEDGLQQIGMSAEEARQVALRLLGGANHAEPAGTADALPPATDLAIRLKQRTRLGERTDQVAGSAPSGTLDVLHAEPSTTRATAAVSASAAAAKTAEPPLTPAEQAMFRHLQRLPFGTWFSVMDKDGQRIERKLSWYSPVSGKCLLVSRRGLRADDLSMRQMACELASGRMQEVMPGRGNSLDQAWEQLTANLRRLGGSGRQSAAV